ncbi:MAG: histidine--tRNA ligase [Hyphomonadaceae bacterium]|nr:histidine--tRNA ligase [Hyphomonadaceae bacterium]
MADFRPKARRPRGLIDRRGADLAAERAIVERVLAVYEAWGFERLETSAFEYADALGKFLPDQDRPNEGVFALQDDDEQWLALRYDLTAPLARFVAENYDTLPKPYRRCAAGPVWRNEKPGPGRFREFWQCDADTVGSASPAADAEMIAMAAAAFAALGVDAVSIKVNTRRLLNGVMDAAGVAPTARLGVLRAVDKLDRLGIEGVRLLLGDGRKDESGDFTKGAGLAPAAADRVLAFVQAGRSRRSETLAALEAVVGGAEEGVAGLKELAAIVDVIDALGVPEAKCAIDPTIVRGLEYYTGAVFEAQLVGGDGASFGSVGGGGRYDDLVSRFKGQPIPATGFSVGVSRLAAALAAQRDVMDADPLVVALPFDADAMADCFAYAARLRGAGVRAEVYLGGSGPKAQLKYADKRQARVAVIVGGDERAAQAVTLKDLRAGADLAGRAADRDAYTQGRREVQVTVPQDQLVAAVTAMIAAD